MVRALPLSLLIGCAAGDGLDKHNPDPLPDIPCDGVDDPEQSQTVVLRSFAYGRPDGGTSPGFDLDGLQSDAADAGGCYHADFTGPEGQPGVDNGLSAALPVIDGSNASILEGLLQQTINDGGLLITLSLDDLDDPAEDGCARARIGRASGVPMLATDGTVEGGQTFSRDPSFAEIVAEVAVEGGAVELGPFDWTLQLVLFEAPLDLGLRDARLRYRIGEDGGSGYLAGRMMLYQLPDFFKALKSEAYEPVDAAMRNSADLSPDGTGACAEISAVFAFEAVPAFYFEESD